MDADRAESICPGCSGNRSQLRWQLGDRLFRTTDKQFGIQECPDCSLLFLWPVPPADELAGYYPFGYWAGDPSVTGDPSVNGAGLHRRVTEAYRRFMLRDHVRFVRGAIAIQSHLGKSTVDLLDLGCGDGSFLAALGHRPCVGLDLSEGGVRACLSRGLEAHRGSPEQNPFAATPRWTPQKRPLIDTSKPAISGMAAETGGVLPRGLRGAQVGLDLRAPAAWPALEDMAMMQQAIQQGGDGRGVAE